MRISYFDTHSTVLAHIEALTDKKPPEPEPEPEPTPTFEHPTDAAKFEIPPAGVLACIVVVGRGSGETEPRCNPFA